MVVLVPHGEVAKTLPAVRLATHKLIVSVDAVLGLNFLQQPLQANTWPLYCQIVCWLGIFKDLKALSQTLQGTLFCPIETQPGRVTGSRGAILRRPSIFHSGS